MRLTQVDSKRIRDEIVVCFDAIRSFRADPDVLAVFATPNTHDALRFAATEIAEAMDAELRVGGIYARNHQKALDVVDELADHVLMLLTAMPTRGELERTLMWRLDFGNFETQDDPYTVTCRLNLIDGLYFRCGAILRDYHASNGEGWQGNLVEQLIWIFAFFPEMHDSLMRRLERLYAKHVRRITA